MITNLDIMAKDDNWLTSILKIGAIIGGAWLAVEFIKMIGKEKVYYNCPKCNEDIEYGVKQCPRCKSFLSWEKENKHEGTSIG